MYTDRDDSSKQIPNYKDGKDTPRSNLLYSQTNFVYSGDNFLFDKIYTNNQKIFFLSKSNLILVAVFEPNTNSSLIKLYLLHIFTAFLNFIGETVDMLFNTKQEDVITSKTLDRSYNYITKDFFQIKIFEVNFYIIYPLFIILVLFYSCTNSSF